MTVEPAVLDAVRGVHLVGSAPVEDPEHMFRYMSERIGSHLRRLADGETGERDTWILFQNSRLGRSEQLQEVEIPWPPDQPRPDLGEGVKPPTNWKLARPVESDAIELPPLGYAEAALSSYETFLSLKDEGVVPSHIRFMVGLPTPLGVVTAFVEASSRRAVFDAYRAKLLGELREILTAIPHDQLSIQWEAVFELMILEGHPRWRHFEAGDPRGPIRDHLGQLANAVPRSVEMGFHLCYGDAGHRHFVEPADTGNLTWLANAIAQGAQRSLDFLHLPVPKERDDSAYFEPLRDLELSGDTELYLGLVHHTGGAEGTVRRIEAAQQIVLRFGIATECGFGRRSFDTIEALLAQHRRLAAPRV